MGNMMVHSTSVMHSDDNRSIVSSEYDDEDISEMRRALSERHMESMRLGFSNLTDDEYFMQEGQAEHMNETVHQLTIHNEDLVDQLRRASQRLRGLREENHQLKTQLEDARHQIQDKDKELAKVRKSETGQAELESKVQELSRVHAQELQDLEHRHDRTSFGLRSMIADAQKTCRRYEDQIVKLNAQVAQLKRTSSLKDQLVQELQSSYSELSLLLESERRRRDASREERQGQGQGTWPEPFAPPSRRKSRKSVNLNEVPFATSALPASAGTSALVLPPGYDPEAWAPRVRNIREMLSKARAQVGQASKELASDGQTAGTSSSSSPVTPATPVKDSKVEKDCGYTGVSRCSSTTAGASDSTGGTGGFGSLASTLTTAGASEGRRSLDSTCDIDDWTDSCAGLGGCVGKRNLRR